MRAATYSVGHQLGSSARNGALLDNDGALTGVLGHKAGDGLEGSHVGGAAGTNTAFLGGGVDSHEDDVGLGDVAGDVSAEEEVGLSSSNRGLALLRDDLVAGLARNVGVAAAITGNADNVVQARLVDGRVAGVPSADSGHVSVHNGDLDVRVLEGNDCGGRATCSTGRVSISIGITTRPRSSSPKQQPSRRSESNVSSASCSRAATTTNQDAGIGLHTDITSTNAANVADGNLVAVGLGSSAIEAQLLDRVENCFGERAHGDVVTEGHKRETKVSKAVQVQMQAELNEGMGIRE